MPPLSPPLSPKTSPLPRTPCPLLHLGLFFACLFGLLRQVAAFPTSPILPVLEFQLHLTFAPPSPSPFCAPAAARSFEAAAATAASQVAQVTCHHAPQRARALAFCTRMFRCFGFYTQRFAKTHQNNGLGKLTIARAVAALVCSHGGTCQRHV
jgi:hypothetical protein